MKKYRIFWGETHDNTYQHVSASLPIEESFRRAAGHLDFYAAAYYTACPEPSASGRLPLECWKPQERLDREWAELNEVSRRLNEPGRFVTFPGYEWQGNGFSGDHNIIARREGLPIFRVDTIGELYDCLRGKEALAIPHHTAYRPGVRGRDWNCFDEDLSPFCEIFSLHGCSETDEEMPGLRRNTHMGPGIGGGTWQDALDKGCHIGAVCSTDNWGDMPGRHGWGRMACLARDLTREGLWEAFRARRVYGVTGDRIALDFALNDACMGSIIRSDGVRRIRVRAVGSDALDRIEILRNGRVIATHCHQGTWEMPRPEQRGRWKMRIEAGWGPRPNELAVPDRLWEGELRVRGGKMLGFEPCWISPGQGRPRLAGGAAAFEMLSRAEDIGSTHNANVFEFEAEPSAQAVVRMNGPEERRAVGELARSSREMWFKDECVQMLHDLAGIEPYSPERMDVYHHLAYKVKIHRAVPEAAYSAVFEIEDDEPLTGEANYRVRVEQRNGQRAWSSPIWARME